MTAETLDLIHIAALVAASFINRQAFVVLLFMLVGEIIFKAIDAEFWFCIAAGMLYAVNAAVPIRIDYRIRQALIVTGLLYWLCAIDSFLLPQTETILYNSFGYIIGAVDLYVLLLLLGNGGRERVGIDRPWHCRPVNL
jgi:hypothetical protein